MVDVDSDNELMGVWDIARHLRVSRATVQRWCRTRVLPVAKIGKEYRIRRRELDAWYDEQKVLGV